MGNCVSSAQEKAEKARSDAIDRELDEESKRLKKECKILLLGESIQSFSSLFAWALPLVSCMTIHSYLPHDLVGTEIVDSSFACHRGRRIGQVDNRQTDEDNTPKWLYERRTNELPTYDIPEYGG